MIKLQSWKSGNPANPGSDTYKNFTHPLLLLNEHAIIYVTVN